MSFDQLLIKAKPDEGESTAIISKDNIFLADNNQLSSIILIEYINQLNAAVQGYNGKYNNQEPTKGLFVGLQEVEFWSPVYLGNRLNLKVLKIEEVAQVTFIQGIVERAGERVAALVTKLYEARDGSEFDLLINQGQISEPRDANKLNSRKPPVNIGSDIRRRLFTYLQELTLGPDSISFKIACPNEFEAFDGHFPGNPILPGIILLEISNLALELCTTQKVMIKRINKMKISSVVLPNQLISANLKIEPASAGLPSFSAVFKTNEGKEISRCNGNYVEGNLP